MLRHEHYPGQFQVADLDDAFHYVGYCIEHEVQIDLDRFDAYFIADLLLVKVILLSGYNNRDPYNKKV